MTALYALEERIKPYNKYFKWELENYPLKNFPWKIDEFILGYEKILETGDIKTQKEIYKTVKRLFREKGYKKIFDNWKGLYFVG